MVKTAVYLVYCRKVGLYYSGILYMGLNLTYTCRLELYIQYYYSTGVVSEPSKVNFLGFFFATLLFFPLPVRLHF